MIIHDFSKTDSIHGLLGILYQKLAQKCGNYISTAFQILEGRFPEGHRIALALGEVSGRGSSFTIRKFPEKPAFLMLIWAIVLMRRVKLRDGRVVRRMAKVWEITGLDLEANKSIPLNYREVFTWNPFTDTFSPSTPEEAIERSYRLK